MPWPPRRRLKQIAGIHRRVAVLVRKRENRGRGSMRLDHGCRANILVLPTEDFGEYENERMAWRMSFRPRNMAEEVLIDRLVSLAWQEKRIDRAQTARLTKRMWHSGIDESVQQEEDALELGQRLFLNACGAIVLHLHHDLSELNSEDDEPWRMSDYSDDEEHPIRLVHRLQGTLAGCEWLLNQWARLRDLLDQGVPWLASDKLKAVRLLGRHPIDALDSTDVARVYLASHVLLNEGGPAYQEILNELSPDEVPTFERYWKLRNYPRLAPQDAAAARAMLREVVDRAITELKVNSRSGMNWRCSRLNQMPATCHGTTPRKASACGATS